MKRLYSMGFAGIAAMLVMTHAEQSGAADGAEKPEAGQQTWLYKHKTIRRWKTGEFEFKDFHLRIDDAEANERFVKTLEALPRIDTSDIVLVNEAAASSTESRVVRGPLQAGDILTAKDKAALAAANAKAAAGTTTTQTGGLGGLLKT